MENIIKIYDSSPQWLYVVLLLVLCVAALVIFTRKGIIYIQLKRMLTVMFAEYLVLLLCFTIIFREESVDYDVRYLPFHNYFDKNMYLLKDALMNVMMFVPVGFCTSVVLRRPMWMKILLLSGILSCCIELSQFILSRGFCDINDVMNNMFGGLLGYWTYCLVKPVRSKLVRE